MAKLLDLVLGNVNGLCEGDTQAYGFALARPAKMRAGPKASAQDEVDQRSDRHPGTKGRAREQTGSV